MAEVGFYHLIRSKLQDALPQLLVRTLAAKQRALIMGPSAAGLATLSAALWDQPAWLPHGAAADGDPELQPIWLSTDADPVNGARYLFLIEGSSTDRLDLFERVFDLFDGNDQAQVAAARLRWKSAKDAGHAVAYWQQTQRGWQQKA